MSEQENVSRIQDIYAAFGRADLPLILNALAEDVNWDHPAPGDIPWGGARRGRAQVSEFFVAIGTNVEFEEFGVDRVMGSGDEVIALGHERARVRSTGQSYSVQWVHHWTLRDGAVVGFREYTDTATIIKALSPR